MHFIFVSGCLEFKQLFNNPVFKHCQLFIGFFIFSVGLLFADIITDFNAAFEFFQRGDKYWGCFTLIPIFAPFLVRFMMTFITYCQCFKYKKREVLRMHFYSPTLSKKKSKYDEWKSELKLLHWHFPMFQPIRLVKRVILLKLNFIKENRNG
jgi:hypothetical protein